MQGSKTAQQASHFVAGIIYVDYGTKVDREETREEVLPKMESASPLCVRICSGLGAHLSFQHNQLGKTKKVWVMEKCGLSELWVIGVSTV